MFSFLLGSCRFLVIVGRGGRFLDQAKEAIKGKAGEGEELGNEMSRWLF